MKKILIVLSVIGLLAFGAAAQPTVPTNPQQNPVVITDGNGDSITFTNVEQNFFQIAFAWGTSVNTNLAWPTNAFNISTGARYLNNMQWANTLRVEKNIGSFGVDARINNQGVMGVIQSVQGGIGYTLLDNYDFRIEGFVDGGYNIQQSGSTVKGAFVDPELWLKKLMTRTTFAELGIDYMVSPNGPPQKFPGVDFDVGATF